MKKKKHGNYYNVHEKGVKGISWKGTPLQAAGKPYRRNTFLTPIVNITDIKWDLAEFVIVHLKCLKLNWTDF